MSAKTAAEYRATFNARHPGYQRAYHKQYALEHPRSSKSNSKTARIIDEFTMLVVDGTLSRCRANQLRSQRDGKCLRCGGVANAEGRKPGTRGILCIKCRDVDRKRYKSKCLYGKFK